LDAALAVTVPCNLVGARGGAETASTRRTRRVSACASECHGNIYRHVGPLVGLIVSQADELVEKLNKTAGIEPADRENTWANIKELCSKIGPNTIQGELFVGVKSVGAHTVFTLLLENWQITRAWIERILNFSSFLATDLIDLLSAFDTHTHFRVTSQQLSMMQAGLKIQNKTISMWAGDIFNYTTLIRELDACGQRYLPMKYEDRPELKRPEDQQDWRKRESNDELPDDTEMLVGYSRPYVPATAKRRHSPGTPLSP
jgi:hypothetical protein